MACSTDPSVRRETFAAFFDGWLRRLQQHLDELSSPPDDRARRCLIEQVFAHYQHYYKEKARATDEDVFLFFSPPWFTPVEHWVSGFKPSLVFKLVTSSVGDLTAEQAERLEVAKAGVRRAERDLSEAMARLQESVAAPPLYDLLREAGRVGGYGEAGALEAAMKTMKESMKRLMESADAVRGSAVRKAVEILSPSQAVKFLAAALRFQLQIPKYGLQRDPDSQRSS